MCAKRPLRNGCHSSHSADYHVVFIGQKSRCSHILPGAMKNHSRQESHFHTSIIHGSFYTRLKIDLVFGGCTLFVLLVHVSETLCVAEN